MTKARDDFHTFCEYIVRDESGQTFTQAEIHRSWHEHIVRCREEGVFPIIVAPWGHGKSSQLSIARVLWEIGHNVNIRLKVVCNDDNNAMHRVMAVKNYLEHDERYRAVFPRVVPDYERKWDKHEIFVKRSTGAVDPTLQAHSVLATGIGGRCDGIIFDDVVDRKNAVEQPALRSKVADAVLQTWLSRLEPNGWMVYIGTLWHRDDLTHRFVESIDLRQGYCTLVQRISEDMSCIEEALFYV